MKTRQEIKAQAKSIIGGNYSGALLPGLLYLLIAAVASGVTFGLGFIITLPLVVGMTLVYINLWRGEASTIDVIAYSSPSKGTSHSNEVISAFTGDSGAVRQAIVAAREVGLGLLGAMGDAPVSTTTPYI